ncbi:MAG: glutathione S-transferase family protein [Gammaproteobacteria bacterium]|nr:glutathione S-transferase family protein [Gammaproteobacteria bacterium]
MTTGELVLYHAWSSSASRKVRLCLAEKGLDYDGRVLDLRRFQHHSEWYKALNPSGIVPCLVTGGRALVESNLINEFLDELAPAPPLMPDDPLDRHEVRRWSKYVDEICLPAVQKPNWSRTMQPIAQRWSDEELELRLAAIPTAERRALWRRMARDPFTREEIDAALDVLEDMTRRIEDFLVERGGPWLLGERLTLADINVAPYVVRFEEERPGRLPARAAAWWSRFTARPAWRAAEIGAYVEDTERSMREAMEDPR